MFKSHGLHIQLHGRMAIQLRYMTSSSWTYGRTIICCEFNAVGIRQNQTLPLFHSSLRYTILSVPKAVEGAKGPVSSVCPSVHEAMTWRVVAYYIVYYRSSYGN